MALTQHNLLKIFQKFIKEHLQQKWIYWTNKVNLLPKPETALIRKLTQIQLHQLLNRFRITQVNSFCKIIWCIIWNPRPILPWGFSKISIRHNLGLLIRSNFFLKEIRRPQGSTIVVWAIKNHLPQSMV